MKQIMTIPVSFKGHILIIPDIYWLIIKHSKEFKPPRFCQFPLDCLRLELNCRTETAKMENLRYFVLGNN